MGSLSGSTYQNAAVLAGALAVCGAVILLHPTSATNAEVLPALLAEIRAQGYRFGTLYELTGVPEPDAPASDAEGTDG